MTPLRWLITIVFGGLVVFGLFSYKNVLIAAQAEQGNYEPAATIEAMTVESSPYQRFATVNGVTKAVQTLTVYNELSGKITYLNFESGSLVKKGQTLVEQDYSEEQAKILGAQARLDFNQKRLNRYQTLFNDKEISEEQVDEAAAEVKIARSEINSLRSIINKKIIKAPFTARVGIHDLQVGQMLDPNREIIELVGINDFIWLDFQLPQIYTPLSVGDAIEVSLMEDLTQKTMAYVTSVSPSIDTNTRQLKYRAKLMHDQFIVRPNQLLKVRIPISALAQKIMLPNLAVMKSQVGDHVFVVAKDEAGTYRVQMQPVELGARKGDHIVIENGLAVGDYIANTGAFKLRPGLKVFISNQEEPTS